MSDQANASNLKGVIYARYSSDNQREESIDGQLRECHGDFLATLSCAARKNLIL